MKVWFPYVHGGSGADVFSHALAGALRAAGHEAVVSPFAHRWLAAPWAKRLVPAPPGTDVVLGNSWNGFAFRRRGMPLVVVEHLCVLDPALRPYRSAAQAAFHGTAVRFFESLSFRAADAVVAVSRYTAEAVRRAFPDVEPRVIVNGIDTDFFTPPAGSRPSRDGGPVRLLFVGNPSRRKGADLLPAILERLGPGYEIAYTSGLRAGDALSQAPGLVPLGRLDREQTRQAYRAADLLLFPTRLEGLPLTAIEAMACGLPVVASDAASLPEVIEDGVTGRLCPRDDVGAFAAAVADLARDPARRAEMGRRVRAAAEARFSLTRMAGEYLDLFAALVDPAPRSVRGRALVLGRG